MEYLQWSVYVVGVRQGLSHPKEWSQSKTTFVFPIHLRAWHSDIRDENNGFRIRAAAAVIYADFSFLLLLLLIYAEGETALLSLRSVAIPSPFGPDAVRRGGWHANSASSDTQ